MKLPNCENAFVDDSKLIDYCPNEYHEIGKHKAKVFKSALGLTSSNFLILKEAILNAAKNLECTEIESISHGILYLIDFEMTNLSKKAAVRTTWIKRNNEDFPRLVSCYVKT